MLGMITLKRLLLLTLPPCGVELLRGVEPLREVVVVGAQLSVLLY